MKLAFAVQGIGYLIIVGALVYLMYTHEQGTPPTPAPSVTPPTIP